MPAYCTAMGRVLLASLADADIRQFLHDREFRRLTPRTKVERDELFQEIMKARVDGCAISDEELEIGLRSIALPVANPRGQVMLAMSVSLQAARMTPAQMVEQLLPALEDGRRALSSML